MLPWVTEPFLARFPVSVKRCVGLRPTPKIPAARGKSTQGSYMCERLTPGLKRKDWILQALLLVVTSLWPHKVGSRGEIYSARWKLMLLSDQAKDVVKNCFEGGAPCLLFNLWFTSGNWNKSTVWVEKSSMWWFMWGKRDCYGVIWRCFALVKRGSITSGLRKCSECRQSHLLCDLPNVLTGMWLGSCYQKTFCQA